MATNRTVLQKLIKEADELTLVFIRERLLTVCDGYKDEKEVRKAFGDNPFVSADSYINSAKVVQKHLAI